MGDVIVVIGPGSIGQAIARRVSAGKYVLLADLRPENADAAAEVLSDAGFDVNTAVLDVSSRESVHALVQTATARGDVSGVIHAAGVSPSQASPETILSVDLYGTALVLEEFGNVIAPGGSGVVIASQSGHRLGALTAEEDAALAMTPADELLALPMLQPDQVEDSLHAYQLSKRGNSLRGNGRGCSLGKAWRACQHDQSRHHHHPAGQGRTDWASRRGLSTHDRAVPGRPRGDTGRGRNCRSAVDGNRGRVHHRQRLPHGRRGHRRLSIWRSHSEVG
jgi:hypothetical protein